MNTEDIKEKYEKQKNIGILLIIVGIIIVVLEQCYLRFLFPIGIVVGIILFSVGLGFVSRKRIEQLPVESQIELYAKMSTYFYYKRKLKFGIIYFGIGIVLIIIGVWKWITGHHYLSSLLIIVAWVIDGIILLTGVGFLDHSVVIKKRMKKLEKSERMKEPSPEEKKKIALAEGFAICLTFVGVCFGIAITFMSF
ncbi:MAG: hypothetical protein ACFFC1_08435 [Promethearchaeota archaeon]